MDQEGQAVAGGGGAPPEAQPAATPQETGGAQPGGQTQAAAPAEDEGFEEFDYRGERLRLPRNDRHYLMQLGLEAYEHLRSGGGQPQEPEPQPQQQPGQEQEHPIIGEVRDLRKTVAQMKKEAVVSQIKSSAAEALEKNAFLMEIVKDDPTDRGPLMGEIIQFQANHPRMSYENAAKHVEKRWAQRIAKGNARYAKQKLDAAGNKAAPPSGQFPAKAQKFSWKDFKLGKVRESVIRKLQGAES